MRGKSAPVARSKIRKLARLKSRRLAVGEFNALLAELSLPLQALRPKALDVTLFAKVLRILSKRCRGDDLSRRFAAALQRFTDNGGALPDGMEFCPDSTVLDVSSVGLPDEPSAVPRHKFLHTPFRLESKAFMLTFHSASFDKSSWEPFLAHIRGIAVNFGARSWATCLERSEHSQLCAASGERYHCHAYFIWTDGVAMRVSGLDAFVF